MPMTSAGALFCMKAIMNDSPTFFNNANSYLGVGDNGVAFNTGQVDLQASTNKLRKGMADATYPQRSSNALTYRSLFSTGEANFTWAEWGVFNAAAAGEMLSRKNENLGAKTSAAAWQLTVTLTGTA